MKTKVLKIKNQNGNSATGQLMWTFFVAAVLIALGFYHSVNLTQRVSSATLSEPASAGPLPPESEPPFSRY